MSDKFLFDIPISIILFDFQIDCFNISKNTNVNYFIERQISFAAGIITLYFKFQNYKFLVSTPISKTWKIRNQSKQRHLKYSHDWI